MKKNEKFIAVNNQEDEDGYTLYPDNAIPEERLGSKKGPVPDSTTASVNKHDHIFSSSTSGQTRSGSSIIRRG